MFKRLFLLLVVVVANAPAVHAEPLAPNDVKALIQRIREKRA
jgi:hypothetical protein